jgi:SagB-type dehydrogenase family enzyme
MEQLNMNEFKNNRSMMKSNSQMLRGIQSDQDRNLPQPPLQKPVPLNAQLIDIPKVNPDVIKLTDIYSCIKRRRSIRKYSNEALTFNELSFLLWATQGVQRVFGDNFSTFRPAPSGGARHPFETYLTVSNIAGLDTGIYRYLALSHQLHFLFPADDLKRRLAEVTPDQPFVGESAVVFIWSCIPYRGEWRYHLAAHKMMLIDAGHLCQNLYLACTAIGCGACAVGTYDQEKLDCFLGLDGEEEFSVYLAPVGKVK